MKGESKRAEKFQFISKDGMQKAGIKKIVLLALAAWIFAGCAGKEEGQALSENGSGQMESTAEDGYRALNRLVQVKDNQMILQ